MSLLKQILFVALMPILLGLGLTGAIISYNTQETLEEDIRGHLHAIEELRKGALESYIGDIKDDLQIFAQSKLAREAVVEFEEAWQKMGAGQEKELQRLYINDNPNPLGEKDKLFDAGDGSLYSEMHAKYHLDFLNLQQKRGYYDVFLFNTNGDLIYSVFKELDYATNMNTGQWKDTDLANVFRDSIRKSSASDFSFYDFRPYGPSYDAPASFIGLPILDGGKVLGALVFQMPVDRINTLLSVQTGLGKTGETILIGEDYLARNDTALNSESILSREIDSEYVKAALRGKEGFASATVEGQDVALYYAPFTVEDSKYAFIVKQDSAEVFALADELLWTIVFVAVAIGVVVIIAAIVFARHIVAPISQITAVQTELADGNLDAWVPEIENPAEVAKLSKAMYRFKQESRAAERYRDEQEEFKKQVEEEQRTSTIKLANNFEVEVGGVIDVMVRSSEELSDTTSEVSQIASRTAASSIEANEQADVAAQELQDVVASVDQVSSSIGGVSDKVQETYSETQQVVGLTNEASRNVERLNDASAKIKDIVTLISNIADQTNLLALNATIEAARAGDAGKGFAVVANEVKSLANQTSNATEEISRQVSDMLSEIAASTSAVNEISRAIHKTSETMELVRDDINAQVELTGKVQSSTDAARNRIIRVVDLIDHVAEDAGATGAATEQLQMSSKELANSGKKLSHDTESFIEFLKNPPENTQQAGLEVA